MMFKSVFFALEQAQFNHDIIHKVNTESRALSGAFGSLRKTAKEGEDKLQLYQISNYWC